MTLRLLRPILPLALALGLSACGGSDSYPVNVTVDGLLYDRVVLTDTKSGKTLTVTPVGTVGATQKLIFPVTLSYGDEYNIIIKEADAATSTPSGQPAHQSCVLGRNADTAGRLSDITVVVSCSVLAPTVDGDIVMTGVAGAVPTGLTIVNGSRPAFVALATSTSYAFTNVTYNTTFSPTITAQPSAKTQCAFEPTTGVTMGPGNLSYTGTMGDVEVKVKVICNTVP